MRIPHLRCEILVFPRRQLRRHGQQLSRWQSELCLGARVAVCNHDKIVFATKLFSNFDAWRGHDGIIQANYAGKGSSPCTERVAVPGRSEGQVSAGQREGIWAGAGEGGFGGDEKGRTLIMQASRMTLW